MKLLEGSELYSLLELVVKSIIFNIKVFMALSDRALRHTPCSNDVTYLKNDLWASAPKFAFAW